MGRESRSSSRSSTAASDPVAKKTGSAAAKRAQAAAAEEEAIRQDDELTVMVLINDNDRSGPDRLGVLPKTEASAKKQPGKSREPTTAGKATTVRPHGPAPITAG